MNPLSDLERLVAAIEHQGANIAPTYQEYMPIAFATANDCGEAGRTFFHRICRLSEKYVYEEADKLYDHALKAGNGRNGLGSVFHWAEIAGVKTDKQLADTFRQYPRENKNPSNLQAPLTPTHAHTYAREDLRNTLFPSTRYRDTHIRTHVRTCHPLSRIIRGPRSSSR